MATIHPTAIVEGECNFADDVKIGPWCVINGPATIGAGATLIANVHVQGPVTIGERTIVYPGTCIGFPAQDVKFKLGDPTAGAVVGDDCILREFVTIHAATNTETPTRIGNRVFMMVQAHVGHDATLCDEVIMVNNSALGGHGHIGRKATIGGGSFIHQYCRIGRLAFVTGGIGVPNDVPPFCLCSDRNLLTGVNLVGLRRAGFARDDISHIRDAFRYAFRDHRPIQEMISILREIGEACPAVLEMAEFVDTPNRRAICAGVGRPSRSLAYWLQKMRKGEDLSAVLELEND